MTKPLFIFLFLFQYSLLANSQDKTIVKGLKLTKTVRIKKAAYRIDAGNNLDKPVLEIEGNNIVIDFSQAELKGSSKAANPSEFSGLAILIQNSNKVTLKHLKVKGYKVAILARNVQDLVLEDCDLSYNYRQHLNSTQEAEDLSDWMSYHHNDKNEWLRYGAAIYLDSCTNATIRKCKVTGGQNALMMNRCTGAMIYNNDFSFNSGIGVGMYRCTGNSLLYNRIIFNVRGYSHGVYARGQDSAGILVYEQSSNNIFYKNNVTHGGDGFFLWAGQTTMDSGLGGCNDNLIISNDFSDAPTNGIEATFSRNTFLSNRIFGCDNGFWGGYSYSSLIRSNQFRDNKVGVAIEHGQHDTISYNLFAGDKEAIKLWSRAEQPTDWGYAKARDTRSAAYIIASNSFNKNRRALNISRTDSVFIFNNTSGGIDTLYEIEDNVTNIDTLGDDDIVASVSEETVFNIPAIAKPDDPFSGNGYLAGRKNIRMTEWGPYDYKSPLIWLSNPKDTSDLLQFDLLGPKGSWVIKKSRGIDSLSSTSGGFPSSITARKKKSEVTDILIELEYIGQTVTSPLGEAIPAGKPYTFKFRKYFQPLNWEVLFFSMDTSRYNPLKQDGLFAPNVRMAPIKTEEVKELNYSWWGGIKVSEETYKQFLTTSSASFKVPDADYELSVTWDDAVRVYLDNKLILNEWNPSKYDFDESPNRSIKVHLGGEHQMRVEHVELGGFATLGVKLKKL